MACSSLICRRKRAMKVLILSCNTGGGHNSVAGAVQELYESMGATADIVDALSFEPYGVSEFISNVHNYVYRNVPQLFGQGFFYAKEHPGQLNKGHPARLLLGLGARKLAGYIVNNGYDQVLCCHIFAGILLSDAIRRFHLSVVSCLISTDYTVDPGTETCDLSFHFVPVSMIKERMAAVGVPSENIVVSGIPVQKRFYSSVPMSEAKTALGISPDSRHILLVCGSMGCGPLDVLMTLLTEKRAPDSRIEISVVCGTNEKLYSTLHSQYSTDPTVHVYGYIQNMELFLDSADVYITKPGGISITEAAVKKKALVLINAVGGCEADNMECFTSVGAAIVPDTVAGLADAALELCCNSSLRHRVEEATGQIAAENDIRNIYSAMTSRS